MDITSSTDICNLALDLLSAGNVTNIEDPTTATESLLGRWYNQSRRKLLREHPWNFAIKRVTLAASATAPAFGYAKAFPLPSDFIRVLYISLPIVTNEETILPTSEYQIENGRVLITDNYGQGDTINLVYIYDFKNVSLMDPMFVDLLVYEVALGVAYKVTENNTNIQRIGELQKRRSALARAIDGQERPPTRFERSRALSARRNSGGQSHRVIF